MQTETSQAMTVFDPETGEVIEQPTTLDGIARLSTGGLTGAVKTSFDLQTDAGRQGFDELRQVNLPKDHKQNDGWYGRPFVLDNYLCTGYLGKRDSTGQQLKMPEPRIRTVVRDTEGRVMVSSSSFLYESLMVALASHAKDGAKSPLHLKLVKSGPTDQLQRVYPGAVVPGKKRT